MNKSQKAKLRRQGKPVTVTTFACDNAEDMPQRSINGLTFFPVPEVTDLDIAFGARAEKYFNRRDLPQTLPRKFEDMAQGWFFSGGSIPDFHPAVDRIKAIRAIKSWLSSFAPCHESKMATVGYAVWLWTHPTALNKV